MNKWLSVCIFLLLAIACIVDVEPTEIVTPVTSVAHDEIGVPVTPDTLVEIVTPGAVAREQRTSASSPGTESNTPRAVATRGFRHAAAR